MAYWSGFQPKPPTGPTLAQWVRLTEDLQNADGTSVRWWEGPNCGLELHPSNCVGPAVVDFQCNCDFVCDCGTPAADIEASGIGPHTRFEPFWVDRCMQECELRDTDEAVRQRLNAEFDTQVWHGLARRLWQNLTTATNSEGDLVAQALGNETMSIEQGLGVLAHARADVGGGVLLAPGYLEGGLLKHTTRDSVGRLNIGGRPLIIDPSFNEEGPTGTVPASGPLEGWMFHIDQLPLVAARPPVDSKVTAETSGHAAGCCSLYRRRRQAVTAFNPCRVYAVKVGIQC